MKKLSLINYLSINYLTTQNYFSNSQFGFRKSLSTKHAIVDIYDDLDTVFFLYSSKAFDCVDHDILPDKMTVYGVLGIASIWLKSYLSDRQQHVFLKGALSQLCSIDRGVQQGSIQGPYYFSFL